MEFVNFSMAKKLNKKGFNKECFAHYDDLGNLLLDKDYWKLDSHILAPTISQVLKWLRESKRIDTGAVWDNRDCKWVGYVNEMDMPDLVGEYILPNTYNSYELAAIAVIEYIIDNNLI